MLLESSQIIFTIPPVAESLGLNDSDVSIESFTAASSSRRRQEVVMLEEQRRLLNFEDGAWDIQYLLQIPGINKTFNTQTQLNYDSFVEDIGDSISTYLDINVDWISTQNVSIFSTSASPTRGPSESPTQLPDLVVAAKQSSFSTTILPFLLVVFVGIGFLVLSICALRYDYKAIKIDHAKPLQSQLVPSTNI